MIQKLVADFNPEGQPIFESISGYQGTLNLSFGFILLIILLILRENKSKTQVLMEKQMTATAYVLNQNRVLLVLHPKLHKWLPPGGHLEPNELPTEAAIREVLEETGLEVAILKEEHLWVERWNAKSFERPFLCLLENIPEHKGKPAHQHIDFIYLATPIGGAITQAHQTLQPIRWFSLEEVMALESDLTIFTETQMTIQKIFAFQEQRLTTQISDTSSCRTGA